MATSFEDLHILNEAENIADSIWEQVKTWDNFSRDVVGKQITRAADSIGANIAESYGRFHFGEKLRFLYYARGSLFETKYWINRCRKRNLLTNNQSEDYARKLTQLARQLNRFAKSLKFQKKNKQREMKEPKPDYLIDDQRDLFSTVDFEWLKQPESTTTKNLQSPISNLHQGNNHD